MHRTKKHDIRRRPDMWMTAVVAIVMTAAISSSCLFGTATNVCENTGRRCDPGQTCATKQDVCIDIGGCGDGIVERDKGEVCDDGNIIDGDGCSANCRSDETCGNGTTDVIDPDNPKETCDDGNRISGDLCSAECFKETCGDGIYNPLNKEKCDTAGDTQACNRNCTIPRCGDGYKNENFIPFGAIAPEQCDDVMDEVIPDPADPTMTKTISADTESCNGDNHGSGGIGSCRFAACGDRYVNGKFVPGDAGVPEHCDNGSADTPECNGNLLGDQMHPNNRNAQCQPPQCGDGYANSMFTPPDAVASEQCDELDQATGRIKDSQTCNGNNNGANGRGSCRTPSCGDGYVNIYFTPPDAGAPEQCDELDETGRIKDSQTCNGNNNGANGRGSCRTPSCGDGYKNVAFVPGDAGMVESCDNGSADTSGCNGNNNPADDAGHSNNMNAQCQNPRCGDRYVNRQFMPTDAGVEECEPAKNGAPEIGDCAASQMCLSDCRCH